MLRVESALRGFRRSSYHGSGIAIFSGNIRCSLGREYGVWSSYGTRVKITLGTLLREH